MDIEKTFESVEEGKKEKNVLESSDIDLENGNMLQKVVSGGHIIERMR